MGAGCSLLPFPNHHHLQQNPFRRLRNHGSDYGYCEYRPLDQGRSHDPVRPRMPHIACLTQRPRMGYGIPTAFPVAAHRPQRRAMLRPPLEQSRIADEAASLTQPICFWRRKRPLGGDSHYGSSGCSSSGSMGNSCGQIPSLSGHWKTSSQSLQQRAFLPAGKSQ